MPHPIVYLSAILFFTSCTQNEPEQQPQPHTNNTALDSVAILNDPRNNLNIQTNSFSEIDNSGVLMFPLSMGESERGGGSLSYKEISGNSFWNIIFFDGRTNEYHLLSEQKMLIRGYDLNHSSNAEAKSSNVEVENFKAHVKIEQTSEHIFYSITSDDYDNDRRLTNEDPTYLFVSDKEGKNFRQVSPRNYDLQNWKFIKSLNRVLLTVKKDSDKNNKFDENDEVNAFEIDIDKNVEPKEIFSKDFKNKLKILFDRDWKRLKK